MTETNGYSADHLAAKRKVEQARIDPERSVRDARKNLKTVTHETLRRELEAERAGQ